MKKLIFLILCGCLMAGLLAGCAPAKTEKAPLGANVTGASLTKDQPGEDLFFTVYVGQPEKDYSVPVGQTLGIRLSGAVSQGSLHAILRAPDGSIFWDSGFLTGNYHQILTVAPNAAGDYHLGLKWDEPVKATYNLEWQMGAFTAPQVPALALFGGAGMMLVALGFILYALIRRLGVSYLLLGALAWVITVALKFAWAIPFNGPISQSLLRILPEAVAYPIIYAYVGALTGIFEVGVTYLLLRFTPLGKASWSKALAFGIGFGAVEALLLGFSSLASVLIGMVAPQSLPYSVLESLAQQGNLLYGAAPVLERLFTVLIHIYSNVLIFYAVAARKPGAFWLAFVYKTFLDSVAAWGQIVGVSTLARLWGIEAVVIVLGAAGWLGTRRLAERYPQTEAPAEPVISTAAL